MKIKNDITFKPLAYSCYFEVQLDESDFGLNRKKHNKIGNELLVNQIKKLNEEGLQFSTQIDNEELIENILGNKTASPQKFTWEHCPTSTAHRPGVLRLIPARQHTKSAKNPYWQTIHPDNNDRGGITNGLYLQVLLMSIISLFISQLVLIY